MFFILNNRENPNNNKIQDIAVITPIPELASRSTQPKITQIKYQEFVSTTAFSHHNPDKTITLCIDQNTGHILYLEVKQIQHYPGIGEHLFTEHYFLPSEEGSGELRDLVVNYYPDADSLFAEGTRPDDYELVTDEALGDFLSYLQGDIRSINSALSA